MGRFFVICRSGSCSMIFIYILGGPIIAGLFHILTDKTLHLFILTRGASTRLALPCSWTGFVKHLTLVLWVTPFSNWCLYKMFMNVYENNILSHGDKVIMSFSHMHSRFITFIRDIQFLYLIIWLQNEPKSCLMVA